MRSSCVMMSSTRSYLLLKEFQDFLKTKYGQASCTIISNKQVVKAFFFFALLVPACIRGNRATHKTSNTCWYIKRTGEHGTQSQTLFFHLLLRRWFISGWNIRSAKHRVIINLYDQMRSQTCAFSNKVTMPKHTQRWPRLTIYHWNLLIILSLYSFSDFFFRKT